MFYSSRECMSVYLCVYIRVFILFLVLVNDAGMYDWFGEIGYLIILRLDVY